MDRDHFTTGDQEALCQDAKLAFLATLDPEGQPHLTLLTSLQSRGPRELVFGQFCEGLSKTHLRRDPRAGFLVMDLGKRTWRGRARWTGARREGEEFDSYNRKPLFRYNSYFGIHTVHYLDLVACNGPEPVSMPRLVAGAILARTLAPLAAGSRTPEALTPFTRGLLDRMDGLKFLAVRGPDGWPDVLPMVAAASAGPGRVLVAGTTVPLGSRSGPGSPAALLAMNLAMESVLVRGFLRPFRGVGPLAAAVLQVESVYNSMPPKAGFVWPRDPLQAVVFEDP